MVFQTRGEEIFRVVNWIALALISVTCLYPYLYTLAISLSSNFAVESGKVILWPVGFTLTSYELVLVRPGYMQSFWIAVQRTVIGTAISMLITILTAYPLSKSSQHFKARTAYSWTFVATMFVSGGMIPSYMVVRSLGLIDNIWALILPCALQVYNVVILINFLRGLPKELEESAHIDGAGHATYLMKIALPLSKACMMTLLLFTVVFHWNSWFDGLLYMNKAHNFPLQTYIQENLLSTSNRMLSLEELQALRGVSMRTLRACAVLIASLPVLLIYPFVQKFFVTGITLGSVKG